VLTTLYSFCSQMNCADGRVPYAELVQATNGDFYGTRSFGGLHCDCGTVFKITPTGNLTTLYRFDISDGYQPAAALVQATNGDFYGTTSGGGNSCLSFGCGTVFKITPSGSLTILHLFCSYKDCLDGFGPRGALVQAPMGTSTGQRSLAGPLLGPTPA
jgi:uncharacterized repeat protein (TIGR03803 family)